MALTPDINVAHGTLQMATGTLVRDGANAYRYCKLSGSQAGAIGSGELMLHRYSASALWTVTGDFSDAGSRNHAACVLPTTATTVPDSATNVYFYGQTEGTNTKLKKTTTSVMSVGATAIAHTSSDGQMEKVGSGTAPTHKPVAIVLSKASTTTTVFKGLVCLEGW